MPDEVNDMARRALAIAQALALADPGDKAAARRMGPEGAPVFWRQVARLDIPAWQEAGWLQFTRAVALMTSAARMTSIHDPAQKLGRVLASVGYSERRLAQLMAARGSARADALERAIRMIARNAPGLDVTDLARAIFFPADSRPLARAYYAQFDMMQSEDATDE